jgi:4'-phosphopantetheinyl transferase EntD
VAVAQAAPALVDDRLYPEELAHVARAVERRRAQFGTARVCARRALAELGFAPCSLVPHADRSPRWPEGAVGSISHTDDDCAVVVARSSDVSSLGLDIERLTGAGAIELEPLVCTTAERRGLARWPAEERARMLLAVFSAKEAFYKCQYPRTRRFLDFLDAEVHFDFGSQTFAVSLVREGDADADWARSVRGRFLWLEDRIVTAAEALAPT